MKEQHQELITELLKKYSKATVLDWFKLLYVGQTPTVPSAEEINQLKEILAEEPPNAIIKQIQMTAGNLQDCTFMWELMQPK